MPFLTKVAGYLISGGTDALNENAAELAKDARISIEKLGPTYVKMGQMMSVRPDVLPQVRGAANRDRPGMAPRRDHTPGRLHVPMSSQRELSQCELSR